VNSSGNTDQFQSAYRRGYSTETALLKITSDIYDAADTQKSTILVALDQSAAFDCIDHNTLVSRLEHTFGFSGSVLSWIKSYLDSRSAFVKYGTLLSDIVSLESRVPQGSSLGPALSSLYIAPLSRVITFFGVRHHQYADDTQLYISVAKSELSAKADIMESCVRAIHDWLLHNGLSLNPAKSEVIQFGTRRSTANKLQSLSISGTSVQLTTSVKRLGVTLDEHLSLDQHINNVCKACYYHIRSLRHVHQSLPDDVA